MSYYEVKKSSELSGVINVQGSKNAVLPIMAASILAKGTTILRNCPDISDVRYSLMILKSLGCDVEMSGSTIYIDADILGSNEILPEYSEKMRSSFVMFGAVLARCRRACASFPGGCRIGRRPVDLHLKAFELMGTQIDVQDKIYASIDNPVDSQIDMEFPSVGATENAMLLAAGLGVTVVINNGAKEPEVVELAEVLSRMGADITGAGTDKMTICGITELKPVDVVISGDRICAGTYIAAVGMCGGRIEITGIPYNSLSGINSVMRQTGIVIEEQNDGICAHCHGRTIGVSNIETGPYPGFPTDMQSQIMALSCVSEGVTEIRENIFENRFRIVPELIRMGAQIQMFHDRVTVNGVRSLTGCNVTASELRGGAALILAGLAAEGTTKVYGTGYINRGYENIVRDLKKLGADICEKE